MSAIESCFAATRALCNECGCLTDAKIVFRDEAVFLVKWCPDHGRTEALICSDADWYRRSLAYVKPGTIPLGRAVDSFRGCPDSCGLCPEHQQHTCVPILEITDRCDLACPICLVGKRDNSDLPVEQIRVIVDRLIAFERKVNMLTLSGGEPTVHHDFIGVVDEVLRPEIGIVSVSTNGIALADNDDLIRALRDRGVVIALQLDGFLPATYDALRGDPKLADVKKRVIDRILSLDARMSITMTVARGVNESEVGSLLSLLFDHDQIVSMMLQPVAHSARARRRYEGRPDAVLTTPDVVDLLVEGSKGVLDRADFSPLPCSHPSCFTLTYLLRTLEGGVLPLPRIIESDVYLDTIKNQALLNTDAETLERVRDSLYTLWSSDGMVPNRDAVLSTVKQLVKDMSRLGKTANHREVLDVGVKHIKSIFIHHFMDRWTFDLSRVVKCCNHYPQVDGRFLPACVRNNLSCYASREG
jgi:tetraether lipid synthase